MSLRPRRAPPAIYALILAPARELAAQVHAMLVKLAQYTDVRVALAVGGLSLASQASALRARPEIVVATPVRREEDGCVRPLCARARPAHPRTPPGRGRGRARAREHRPA